jgi:hypothetical protein
MPRPDYASQRQISLFPMASFLGFRLKASGFSKESKI